MCVDICDIIYEIFVNVSEITYVKSWETKARLSSISKK